MAGGVQEGMYHGFEGRDQRLEGREEPSCVISEKV
jgi:hypothetical protein